MTANQIPEYSDIRTALDIFKCECEHRNSTRIKIILLTFSGKADGKKV